MSTCLHLRYVQSLKFINLIVACICTLGSYLGGYSLAVLVALGLGVQLGADPISNQMCNFPVLFVRPGFDNIIHTHFQ